MLEQHRGGAVLLDQRRPRDLGPCPQLVAAIDLRGEWLARIGKIDGTLADRRSGAGRGKTRKRQLRPLPDSVDPYVDDLHRLLGRMVCVTPLVEFVECSADDSAITALELRQLHWHGQRKFLADVAQIELNLILRIGAVAQ